MKTKLKIIMMIAFLSSLVQAQTLQHPWNVLDGGGGISSGAAYTLSTSVGQAAIQKMTYVDTGAVIEGGYIPGTRNLSGAWTTATITLDLSWNLLSVPLITPDMRQTTLYSSAISSAFKYEPGGYVEEDTLEMGYGYWLKFPSSQSFDVSGTQIENDTVPVYVGWNMIGALSHPILASSVTPISPVAIQSSFFGFLGGYGYYDEDTLKPGNGYWVKVDHVGFLVLQNSSFISSSYATSSPVAPLQQNSEAMGKLVGIENISYVSVKDKNDQERKLYYASSEAKQNINRFELPPIPPDEILDVRYSTQRYAEFTDITNCTRRELPIRIHGGEFPLVLSWDESHNPNLTAILEIKYIGERPKEIPLIGCGSITIKEENYGSAKLILLPKSSEVLPHEFALYQNYPNPFNPITKIRYDLPRDSRVSIKVYNVLGQVVANLIDEVQQAGFKSLEWDTRNTSSGDLSSGIYFYRLEVDDYTAMKKLTLLK